MSTGAFVVGVVAAVRGTWVVEVELVVVCTCVVEAVARFVVCTCTVVEVERCPRVVLSYRSLSVVWVVGCGSDF